MNENTIDSLKEALKHSPDNAPLRHLLAETLLTLGRLEEAETEYTILLKTTDENKAKIGLAAVFFKKGNYSACNVILEEVIENGTNDLSAYTLYAKALLKENSLQKAIAAYQKALMIDPKYFDEELDNRLRDRAGDTYSEPEEDLDIRFLQKPNIDFKDVGGMELVKRRSN